MSAPMKMSRTFKIRTLFQQNLIISSANRQELAPNVQLISKSRLLTRNKSSYKFQSPFEKWKTPAVVCLAGLGAGIAYGLWEYVSKTENRMSTRIKSSSEVLAQTTPRFPLSRSIKHDTDDTGLKLTIYQYQTCPFCCKVRAYLDYHGFSYDVVEVNSVWRTQTRWTKYSKVPILVCEIKDTEGFVQINDSSVIMSLLESHLFDRSQHIAQLLKYYPVIESVEKRKTVREWPNRYFVMYGNAQEIKGSTDKSRKEERRWRKWVDDDLVHVLSPNIYRTPSEALDAFRYFDKIGNWQQNFSNFERTVVIYVGAAAMFFVGRLLKRKYALKEDVRESLYDSCQVWTKAVGPSRKFMGGEQPNLADISVYGVLSAIEGCESFNDMMNETKMGRWYYDMKSVVDSHQGGHPLNKVH